MVGKATRGRPRTWFAKQIVEDTQKTTNNELKITMTDREKWRSLN